MFNPVTISLMARKGRAIALATAILVPTTTAFVAEAAEGGSWVVASAEGAVSIDGTAAGASVKAVGPGSVIETGADGNVVLTRPGDSITVLPNSKLSVPANATGGESGILQTLGKLLFRMESRESRDFEIKTPYLAAAIKGTTFSVEVDDDDATVEVEEGSVLVTANRSGQSTYVGPGERASVSGDNGDSVKVSDDGDDNDDGKEEESEEESDDDDKSDDDKSDDDKSDDDKSDDDKSDRSDSDDSKSDD